MKSERAVIQEKATKHVCHIFVSILCDAGCDRVNTELSILHIVKSLGCFRDTGRRAVPQMDGRDPLVTGYYKRRADAIIKCALVAMRRRWPVFTVQNGGWCATGSRAHVTYRKYGRSNRCRNGKGGPWANDVYRIYGILTFILFIVDGLNPGVSVVCLV